MLKKFVEGLFFGGGFGVAFIAIWYLAALYVSPLVRSRMDDAVHRQISSLAANDALSTTDAIREGGRPFDELGVDEQIKQASAIALATYERAPDGRMKAIIKEFLKRKPGVAIHYNVGDEFPSVSLYPKENTSYGDGVVIFFTGSPATMRISLTYADGRITGLGDIPLKVFRDKCKAPDA